MLFEPPTDVETPAVVIDHARMVANAERMNTVLAARGVRLRPHAKTHKSIHVGRIQLAAGAAGLTTATLSEAEAFASAGFDDLFVAYPVWVDDAKSERLRRLLDSVDLKVGSDSIEAATRLGRAARGASRALQVLVEVDSGDGRSGVASATQAVEVADAAAASGCTVVGAFTHAGHSYASPTAHGTAGADEVRALAAAAEALTAAGHDVATLSAGSTPTALTSASGPVTEERPGTYIFGDRQQMMLGAVATEDVALLVVATVVSTAQKGHVILDAGAKVLAKDRHPELAGHGWLPAYPDAVITRVYDHHSVLEPGNGPRPRLGDRVSIVPNHVCPVVNLTHELVVVDGSTVLHWPVDARACNA